MEFEHIMAGFELGPNDELMQSSHQWDSRCFVVLCFQASKEWLEPRRSAPVSAHFG
jgi:hypothetical protein